LGRVIESIFGSVFIFIVLLFEVLFFEGRLAAAAAAGAAASLRDAFVMSQRPRRTLRLLRSFLAGAFDEEMAAFVDD
jgi:hypothetical protein